MGDVAALRRTVRRATAVLALLLGVVCYGLAETVDSVGATATRELLTAAAVVAVAGAVLYLTLSTLGGFAGGGIDADEPGPERP